MGYKIPYDVQNMTDERLQYVIDNAEYYLDGYSHDCRRELNRRRKLAEAYEYEQIIAHWQIQIKTNYMNILNKANEIINERSEEKERQYGPFDRSMKKAAIVASELCDKVITTEDFYKCMIALKISRMAYNLKEDTLLDAVAYIAALNNYSNE